MKPPSTKHEAPEVDIQGPAIVTPDHVQDRTLSKEAGAKKGTRKLDGLAWMVERKEISRLQLEAGRRLQQDYAISQLQDSPKSGGERTGGRRSWDLPGVAHDAGRRVKAAQAVLPAELVSIMTYFLLPDFEKGEGVTNEEIAKRVREDKRAMPLAIRIGLSLLARHYGG